MATASSTPAFAADPASPEAAAAAQAQELLRQQARQKSLRDRQEPSHDVHLQAPTAPQGAGALPIIPEREMPCFAIHHIELEGEQAAGFRWAVAAAYVPADPQPLASEARCLGSAGINLVMKRIQNAIIDKGFVTTRVFAAQQDLRSGTLRLTLVPGRVRSIRFADGTGRRATAFNAMPAQAGRLLDLRDIEQALENFKRIPSAESDVQIAPAQGPEAQPGESDIVIAWQQARPLRLSASLDDGGTRSTGKYQGGLTLSYDHPLRLNDLFYVNLGRNLGRGDSSEPGERGSRAASLHYSLPFGYWLLGFTGARSKYSQTVAGATQSYLYKGESLNHELKLSRVIHRDDRRKSTAAIAGWVRKSRNHIDDLEVEAQRRRMAGWELGLAHREFVGASIIDARVGYRRGTGAFKAEAAPEEAFGEGTSRLKLVMAEAQLAAPFEIGGLRLRYTGTWRAQWNRTPLVPQDRFSIGGRYTVRGFDGEAVLAADRGWLVRNDIGLPLGPVPLETYVGLDHGHVGGSAAQLLSGTRLSGAVLGVRGNCWALSCDAFVGAPLSRPDNLQGRNAVTGFNLYGTF